MHAKAHASDLHCEARKIRAHTRNAYCGKCRCAPSSHHFRDAEKLDQIRKENQQLLTIQEPDFRKSNCYASTANIPDQTPMLFHIGLINRIRPKISTTNIISNNIRSPTNAAENNRSKTHSHGLLKPQHTK